MNSTVWIEQIDRGLLKFIPSVITLNRGGTVTPVPVRIRKADEDFKKEDYPMVTIYNLWISKRDEVRYFPFKVLNGVDPVTAGGKLERTAVPYTLQYQIDFWSVLQQDMNSMLAQWEFQVSRDFNLPVIDSGGTLRYAHALQKGDNVPKTDKLNDGSRVFNTSLTYRIWGELDEENVSNIEDCNIVTDIDLIDKSM